MYHNNFLAHNLLYIATPMSRSMLLNPRNWYSTIKLLTKQSLNPAGHNIKLNHTEQQQAKFCSISGTWGEPSQNVRTTSPTFRQAQCATDKPLRHFVKINAQLALRMLLFEETSFTHLTRLPSQRVRSLAFLDFRGGHMSGRTVPWPWTLAENERKVVR
jgi:hypothetical protein